MTMHYVFEVGYNNYAIPAEHALALMDVMSSAVQVTREGYGADATYIRDKKSTPMVASISPCPQGVISPDDSVEEHGGSIQGLLDKKEQVTGWWMASRKEAKEAKERIDALEKKLEAVTKGLADDEVADDSETSS